MWWERRDSVCDGVVVGAAVAAVIVPVVVLAKSALWGGLVVALGVVLVMGALAWRARPGADEVMVAGVVGAGLGVAVTGVVATIVTAALMSVLG